MSIQILSESEASVIITLLSLTGSKKDTSSSMMKDVESKLQKSVDDNKLFITKISSLEDKYNKLDASVSFTLL